MPNIIEIENTNNNKTDCKPPIDITHKMNLVKNVTSNKNKTEIIAKEDLPVINEKDKFNLKNLINGNFFTAQKYNEVTLI